jgi:hypothetical protein
MSEEALHGLACPRCGGVVPIPEGQAIVICPFCDLRSWVSGENGVRRYQVPLRIAREQALQAYQKFLSGNMAIAGNARQQSQVSEVFLVHLPYWAAWGLGLAWTFGEEEVGSGDDKHYEPRERQATQELSWNDAACDVMEFGVTQINLSGRPLEPFNAESLHRSGMVFEPTSSSEEALLQANKSFEDETRAKASLDRISQSFVRVLRSQLSLVYYPVWVVRYHHRGRSFQVVVDGFSGEVLYGKAPGNVLYRAAVLVGGMALGSFLSVDVSIWILQHMDDDSSIAGFLIPAAAGLALMYFSYRTFRYGEHYEYRRYSRSSAAGGLVGNIRDTVKAVNRWGGS